MNATSAGRPPARRDRARAHCADAVTRQHGALRHRDSCARIGMSLSPRPESPISTRVPGFFAAQRFAPASACELSSAGRMPSVAQQLLERRQRLVVAGRDVLDAADRLQQRVLRARRRDNRVRPRSSASPGSGRACRRAASCACRAARRACRTHSVAEWSPSFAPRPPASTPKICDAAIGEKAVEDADRVRAAADAREHGVGQAARLARSSAHAPRGR